MAGQVQQDQTAGGEGLNSGHVTLTEGRNVKAPPVGIPGSAGEPPDAGALRRCHPGRGIPRGGWQELKLPEVNYLRGLVNCRRRPNPRLICSRMARVPATSRLPRSVVPSSVTRTCRVWSRAHAAPRPVASRLPLPQLGYRQQVSIALRPHGFMKGKARLSGGPFCCCGLRLLFQSLLAELNHRRTRWGRGARLLCQSGLVAFAALIQEIIMSKYWMSCWPCWRSRNRGRPVSGPEPGFSVCGPCLADR